MPTDATPTRAVLLPTAFPTPPVLSPTEPSLGEFLAAISDHAARARIGLYLTDADARLLLTHPQWAGDYYRQWLGDDVEPERGAPIAMRRSEAVRRPVALGPAPLATPVDVGESARSIWRTPIGELPVRAALRREVPRGIAVLAASAAVLVAGSVAALALTLNAPTAADPAVEAAPTAESSTAELPTLADPAASGGEAEATTAAKERLVADVTAALDLDAETSGAVPGLDAAVRAQLLRTAEIACMQGVDDAMAERIAASVAGTGDVDAAAGAAIATAMRDYCGS